MSLIVVALLVLGLGLQTFGVFWLFGLGWATVFLGVKFTVIAVVLMRGLSVGVGEKHVS